MQSETFGTNDRLRPERIIIATLFILIIDIVIAEVANEDVYRFQKMNAGLYLIMCIC